MGTSPKGRGMGRGLGALGLGTPVAPPPTAPADEQPQPRVKENRPAKPANGNGDVDMLVPVKDDDRAAETAEPKSGLLRVPISSIAPNPYQPRKYIDPEVLADLAQSIKENGLIQPPVVSYNPDYDPNFKPGDKEQVEEGGIKKERRARYLLIAGERRWQASKLAGLTNIPVVLKEATPLQMLELALVENIQRADLNPLEEAWAYRQLMSDFKMTQESVAQRVGKSRAAVANSLRILELPENIIEAIQKADITEGHARAILMVRSTAGRNRLLREILTKNMSVRQAEESARRMNAESLTPLNQDERDKISLSPAERETRELEEQFQSSLGVRVNLSRNTSGQGKLIVSFDNDEQLNELFKKIVNFEI
jgi:ParB family transcriptional regulator, chromosome partitioning protein